MSDLTARLRVMSSRLETPLFGEAADRIEELEAGTSPRFPLTDDAPPWLIYSGTDGAMRQVDRRDGFTHMDARELHILEALINHCAELICETRMRLDRRAATEGPEVQR